MQRQILSNMKRYQAEQSGHEVSAFAPTRKGIHNDMQGLRSADNQTVSIRHEYCKDLLDSVLIGDKEGDINGNGVNDRDRDNTSIRDGGDNKDNTLC